MMEKDNVKKGMRLIFVDFLGLVIGILNGFFLPMVFSIEGYALFKTFSLYATYAVVFSFGISDGIYLIYGGKHEADTDVSRTMSYYFMLMKMQVVACVIMYILSFYILKDIALVYFVFFIIPLQLINFFRLYYRALGEFDKYSALQAVLVAFELLNTLFAVFYLRSRDPQLFISIKIINHLIVAILFSLFFFGKHRTVSSARLKWADYRAVMKPGVVVLMADMVAALIFSLDRWFVMMLFNDKVFAYYSFAVSLLNLFLVFITSVTNVLYSYISRNIGDNDYIELLKKMVLVVSSFFPAGYFIIQEIVWKYLPEYTGALDFLWILMLALPLLSIINIVFSNLYKASKDINTYLKKVVIILTISFILLTVTAAFKGNTSAIAWAAVINFAVWYIFSSMDFKGTRITIQEVAYLLLLNFGLIAVKELSMGMLASLVVVSVVLVIDILTFYRKEAGYIINTIRSIGHD